MAAETHPRIHLRELTPVQWKSGIAAWLGWFFDGLDMHLYTLVAALYVQELVRAASPTDPSVKTASSLIQAAFLVGWAVGGALFGRIGDRLGRSRALGLTILTYAVFTGLQAAAGTWWQLLIFRFLSALGIGGEWAVGASLISETWPRRWRPWIAAVLQTAVNLGVLIACGGYYIFAQTGIPVRYVFLIGILPAFLVAWIRRALPETEEWRTAKREARGDAPGIRDLFRGEVKRTTLLAILLCSLSLTGWWAFLFWHPQHVRNLPGIAAWTHERREGLVTMIFFLIVAVSIAGNFFAGLLAKLIGYRRGIAVMCAGFFACFVGAFATTRGHLGIIPWFSGIGFFSGVFGLFTMYLPPLFPTLLRTTGAGFSYNIGRIAAAVGTVVFGLFSNVGDFRLALLLGGTLLLPAAVIALFMPEPPAAPAAAPAAAKGEG